MVNQMVKVRGCLLRHAALVTVMALSLWGSKGFCLFAQTAQDLRVAEDRLRYEFSELRERQAAVTPILVAPPQFHWEESRTDFAPAMMEVLRRSFPDQGALIPCTECYENRVYVSGDNRTVIQNGELSLTDLARLRERPGFKEARSVFLSRETPSGISMKLISIEDGRILYSGLADSTQDLSGAERPMGLARELERRRRGEALSYMFIDMGLYPQGLVQLKWLEQWGSRNQHLSGVAIGAYNPNGALGVTYHYMLPAKRQITAGLTGYYLMSGVFSSGGDSSMGNNIVAQGMLHFAMSGSYGFFVSADTKQTISIGISLLNPVLFPFLL
jgi:hypothetical protein